MIKHKYHDDPEFTSLLEPVLRYPKDDGRRLILADWIEDHGGDDWAKAIRLMCADHDFEIHCGKLRNEILKNKRKESFAWMQDWASSFRFGIEGNCVIHRGFISRLSVDVNDFCGVRCDDCNGARFVFVSYGKRSDREPCKKCKETGTLIDSGTAKDLFSSHPIEICKARNKDPISIAGINAMRFGWALESTGVRPSGEIPYCLMEQMSSGDTWVNAYRRWFDSEPKAFVALDKAILKFGRIQAGIKIEDS